MKRILLLAVICLGLSAHCFATWTAVQVYTPTRFACGTPGTYTSLTCTLTVPSIVGAGHPLTFHFVTQFDSSGGEPQQILVSVYACVTAPCTSGNNLESWIIDPVPCRGYDGSGTGSGSTDCAIVVASVGGWQNLTFTRTNPANLHQTMGGDFIELSTNAGAYYFVTAAGAQAPDATTQTMTAVTLPSGNFAVLQAIVSDPSTVSGCGNLFTNAHYGYCQNLNTTSGAAPVWGIAPLAQGAAGTAVAWGEGSGTLGATGSVITSGNQLTQGVTAK